MNKIRWSICDDAEHVRFLFKTGLKKYEELECISESSSASECLESVKNNAPDVLLLDIQLETDFSGLDIIQELKEYAPELKILIISSHDNDDYIFNAFALGASDYILKEQSFDIIYKKIKDSYFNINSISSDIANTLAKKAKDIRASQSSILYTIEIMTRLSVSELEVLKSIYAGKSYKEIAKERFVSLGTIKVLASRIIRKFNYTNMNELIAHLRELQVLDLFK